MPEIHLQNNPQRMQEVADFLNECLPLHRRIPYCINDARWEPGEKRPQETGVLQLSSPVVYDESLRYDEYPVILVPSRHDIYLTVLEEDGEKFQSLVIADGDNVHILSPAYTRYDEHSQKHSRVRWSRVVFNVPLNW